MGKEGKGIKSVMMHVVRIRGGERVEQRCGEW